MTLWASISSEKIQNCEKIWWKKIYLASRPSFYRKLIESSKDVFFHLKKLLHFPKKQTQVFVTRYDNVTLPHLIHVIGSTLCQFSPIHLYLWLENVFLLQYSHIGIKRWPGSNSIADGFCLSYTKSKLPLTIHAFISCYALVVLTLVPETLSYGKCLNQ